MTEIEQKEHSLLRCTVKKSSQVLWKVLKYGTYLAIGILAIVFAFYGAFAIYELILPGITSVWQFLITVPWYVYAGIIGIAAIPVYSALWCIARDLTEEDWESNAADNFAFAFPPKSERDYRLNWESNAADNFAFALVALVFTATAAATAAFALVFTAIATAIATAHPGSIWYYIGRFPGAAYHHYRKKKNMPVLEKED